MSECRIFDGGALTPEAVKMLTPDEAGRLERVLQDGRAIHLYRQIFNYKLTVSLSADATTYEDSYCFTSEPSALMAFLTWDGTRENEPEGWIRHRKTGRRRPNGDRAGEYVWD